MTGAPSRPLSPEGTGWPTSCYPTVLYNAMIHPFTVFPIKGAIWYQGENNVGFAFGVRLYFFRLQIIGQLHKVERKILFPCPSPICHPKNKQEVGKRLAQAALAKTYNKGTYEVPAFLGYRISGRTLILSFDQEVVAKEGTPKGFILAGPDGKYVPAQAIIRGKKSFCNPTG